MAGQNVEGLRYAAIDTPEKYYLKWKEINQKFNPNDTYLLELTQPIREQSDKAKTLLDKNIIEFLNRLLLQGGIYLYISYTPRFHIIVFITIKPWPSMD